MKTQEGKKLMKESQKAVGKAPGSILIRIVATNPIVEVILGLKN